MPEPLSLRLEPPLRWRDVYAEAELYKAAIRVYTKPLFQWRKALATSTDGKTLFDLAGRGLRGLDILHRSLQREIFAYRPAVALHYNFKSLKRKRKHSVAQVTPTGRAIALSRDRIQNLGEVERALSDKEARHPQPTPRERQVLGYHKKYKTTSPLYEKIRAKYPN